MSELTSLLDELGADHNVEGCSLQGSTVLWGVAPTGDVHLGYAPYFLLLKRLQAEGCRVLPLIANYHAYLDSSKTAWKDIDERTAHYRNAFAGAGLPAVVESKHIYRQPNYSEELFRFSRCHLAEDLAAAGATTLATEGRHASLADLIYVATQVLDVHYFSADIVLCGIDEAPIYRYGLPLLGQPPFYRKCSYIYVPMCPGILEAEMHASNFNGNKVLLSDNVAAIRAKLKAHSDPQRAVAVLAEYYRQVFCPLLGARLDGSETITAVEDADALSEAIYSVIQEITSCAGDHILDIR